MFDIFAFVLLINHIRTGQLGNCTCYNLKSIDLSLAFKPESSKSLKQYLNSDKVLFYQLTVSYQMQTGNQQQAQDKREELTYGNFIEIHVLENSSEASQDFKKMLKNIMGKDQFLLNIASYLFLVYQSWMRCSENYLDVSHEHECGSCKSQI